MRVIQENNDGMRVIRENNEGMRVIQEVRVIQENYGSYRPRDAMHHAHHEREQPLPGGRTHPATPPPARE